MKTNSLNLNNEIIIIQDSEQQTQEICRDDSDHEISTKSMQNPSATRLVALKRTNVKQQKVKVAIQLENTEILQNDGGGSRHVLVDKLTASYIQIFNHIVKLYFPGLVTLISIY